MAKYAYRDKGRKNIIYSADAAKEDRNRTFFCPNPACDARLHICAVDGSRTAYFSAREAEHPHIPTCPFRTGGIDFDENQFDETQFIFNDAMNNLYNKTPTEKISKNSEGHNSGKAKKRPPRTLGQIYTMCKSRPVTDTYGDKKIGEMILDNRSEYRHQRGCFGNRIVEAVVGKSGYFYNREEKQIYLAAPLGSQRYSFVLQFQNIDTFDYIQEEIYKNRDKIIVIAGDWQRSGKYNCFIAEIHEKTQVAVIKM